MALVNVIKINVLDNPSPFQSPFKFEITFECLQELQDDLEWKVLYVGSAYDAKQDQVLDESLVGPVPVGLNKFVLQADPPAVDKLQELLGVTVVLVTCSYREAEFVRVGFYVNNEYIMDEQELQAYQQQQQLQQQQQVPAITPDNIDEQQQQQQQQQQQPVLPPPPPPEKIDINKVQRQILADKPRVTKFVIEWDDNSNNNDNTDGNNMIVETAGIESIGDAAVNNSNNDLMGSTNSNIDNVNGNNIAQSS